ncbi:MAG: hypothetical protein KGZ59_07620 [Chitinophagaceae bacterium]|nr:hypothetical protein [Chitinophagaceae bacterium]
MKKYIIIFQLSFYSVFATAQLNTTLEMQNAPTAVLSEWANKNSIINFIITKIDPNPQTIILKTEIKLSDGTVVATTDLTRVPKIILRSGTSVFYSKDVMPLETMVFSGKYKTTLDKTGKLPSDNYQLCVQPVTPDTYQPLAAVKCKFFILVASQLPFLIMPANNDVLNKLVAQTAITFRWTPLTPAAKIPPYYRIQVFEILSNQRPVQALRSNQPILDEVVRGITQYIWQPRLAFNTLDSLPMKFIWTIQTLDDNKQPVLQTDGNGESRSEPFVFSIATKNN